MNKFVPAKSICGDCARATALEGRLGCEWIRDGKMVYGVRYQKREYRSGNGRLGKCIWLYAIVDCPDYIAEGSNTSLKRAQRQARLNSPANEANYMRLAEAIAASVADEYRFALRSGNEGRIKQLEREMKSDHFYMLSGLDGDELIRLMRKEFEEGEQ